MAADEVVSRRAGAEWAKDLADSRVADVADAVDRKRRSDIATLLLDADEEADAAICNDAGMAALYLGVRLRVLVASTRSYARDLI